MVDILINTHFSSGRCQIIHWRQGHKDECQPPPDNDKYNGENKLTSSGLKGVHSEQSGLSEKRLDPKGNLTKVETFFERPSASKATSTYDEIDVDKHQDSSYKDISPKIFFSDLSSSPTLPTHSTLSQTIDSPDAPYASMLIPNNAGLDESPAGGLIFSIDTDNVSTKMHSTPDLVMSNPLSSTTCSSSKELFTFKAEADERIPSSTSGLKTTNDHKNTERSERVDNGFNSSTSSTHNYPPAAASLEARTHAERNETEISKKETSKSLASAHCSTNGGAKSVSFYTSSNAYAHRASFGSKNNAHVANGFSTSVKQVVTKVSRHYSSEFVSSFVVLLD